MKNTSILLILVCLLAITQAALADTIRGIDIEFVTIGNAGNSTDPATGNLYGAVSSNYRIGKYEVTNAQWNIFIAAAGVPVGNPLSAYDSNAYYTGAQQPVNNVSWYEAAQFCNYLTSGNKNLGAYLLGTDGSITVNRADAILTYETVYVIPTEDEWYKAAYFKPNGSGYSLYAYGTNTIPVAGVQSNYGYPLIPWNIGTGMQEQNGTFDMIGNVWEWNETLINNSYRGLRSGSSNYEKRYYLASTNRSFGLPDIEMNNLGFRVASIIPEPASAMLMFLGTVWMGAKGRR